MSQRIRKVTYTDNKKFDSHSWITIKQVFVLKSTFLVVYNAEIDDAKGGDTINVTFQMEYPKRLLSKFKRHYGLT